MVSPAAAEVRRCGWFTNPTPANVYLTDRDGDWWLSAQGRGGVPGFDDLWWGSGNPQEWIETSPAGYGYGCACVDGTFGTPEAGEVLSVSSYQSLPLAQCVSDPALPVRDLVPWQEME
jgi:hypothetical protein